MEAFTQVGGSLHEPGRAGEGEKGAPTGMPPRTRTPDTAIVAGDPDSAAASLKVKDALLERRNWWLELDMR